MYYSCINTFTFLAPTTDEDDEEDRLPAPITIPTPFLTHIQHMILAAQIAPSWLNMITEYK
jgi:hypothetical protein